jgi:hypothetical protein
MTSSLPTTITAVLAMVVVAGGVAASSSREHRMATLGLLVALAASPFLADPLPDARGIVARIAGAALVATLLLMAVRRHPAPAGTTIAGWPVAALVAVSAAVTIAAATEMGTFGSILPADPALFLPASMAGAGLMALAAAPIVFGGEPLRVATGLLLGVAGASLLAAGAGGPGTAFGDLCLAVLMGTLAGAGGQLHHLSNAARPVPGHR